MSRRELPRHQPPAGDALGRWRLGHDPASAGLARRLVTQTLSAPSGPAASLGPAAEKVQHRAALAVSELVTNAIRHARTPVDLEIRRSPRGWVVAVTDGESSGPVPRTPALLAENGRGLHIVHRTSERSGWAPSGSGKVVWVELWDR